MSSGPDGVASAVAAGASAVMLADVGNKARSGWIEDACISRSRSRDCGRVERRVRFWS